MDGNIKKDLETRQDMAPVWNRTGFYRHSLSMGKIVTFNEVTGVLSFFLLLARSCVSCLCYCYGANFSQN